MRRGRRIGGQVSLFGILGPSVSLSAFLTFSILSLLLIFCGLAMGHHAWGKLLKTCVQQDESRSKYCFKILACKN